MRIQSGKKQQPQIRGLGDKSWRPEKRCGPAFLSPPELPRWELWESQGAEASRGQGSVGANTTHGLTQHPLRGQGRASSPHCPVLLKGFCPRPPERGHTRTHHEGVGGGPRWLAQLPLAQLGWS